MVFSATPFPTPPSSLDVVSIINYSMIVTNNLFGIGLLLLLFGVSFLSLSVYSVERRVAASLFITFVASVFLAVLGAVTIGIPIVACLAWLGSYYFLKQNG